jgi:hypothetical protein
MSAVILTPGRGRLTPTGRDWIGDLWLPRQEKSLRRFWEKFILMAGSKGDYLEQKILDHVLGATSYTPEATTYVGLWGTASSINDASHGGTAGEVSGGSYARLTVTNNTTNWPNATGTSPTTKNNAGVAAFQFATASANWNSGANINQMGVLNGNAGTSADKLLLWCDLTTPKPVLNGDTASFAVNAIAWTED